ncbi:hypothetical protein [Chondromyces crocatus]|uniref:Uncharacterized protein n=1 Tax=Chondromyces crocatus TaxID=52 RepID=A0A0K1ENC7_CHOCO|nr:hypothetical protein [Chondromyces crocatus]AKT42364.1 uncharacterized protein CMC5_065900 [Chondromyces crocatus]
MKISPFRGLPALFAFTLAGLTACVQESPPILDEEEGAVRTEESIEALCDSASHCCPVTESCAGLTDAELLARSSNPQRFGTCYWHDQSACPGCACPFYLKNTQLPPPSGFDGGTGCLPSQQAVLKELRRLCASGQCGCEFGAVIEPPLSPL